MRRLLLAAVLPLAVPAALHGQSLSHRFTDLFTFGDCGQAMCLNVDVVGDHGHHYIPSVTQGENDMLAFITGAISMGLSNLPFTAASGGVAFEFVDGAPIATSLSAGGVFGERSQTLGRGRLLAGVNVNSINMSTLRGVPLRDLTLRFAHQNVGNANLGDPAFENDIIEVRTNLDLNLLVTSAFASYGLLDNVDIGILIPVVRASLSGTSEAQIIPFQRPTPHLFGTTSQPSEFAETSSSGTAIGIGDIAVRIKANLYQTAALGMGVAADVRLPTGDSANFLGSGQTSVRAIGILSGRLGDFSPHVNAGVAIRTGSTQNNSIIGAIGFDHLLTEGVTLAVDLLGDYSLGESLLQMPDAVVIDVPARRRVRLTDIPDERDHMTDASLGLKMQLPSEYRVVTNLLFPLSEGGLRPRYVWTLGVERAF
jgi:hypothetical protein